MPSDIEKQLVDRGVDVQAAQKDAARSGSGGNNNPTPPKPEPPKFDLGKFLNDLGSKLGMWKTHEQVGKEQIGILKDNAALLALYRADHNGQDPVDGHEVSRWVSDFFMGDAIQTDDFMNGLATLAPGLARNLIRNSIEDLTQAAGRSIGGKFVQVGESMSARAAAYQSRITGLQKGMSYLLNGVKFDGMLKGVLLEAKGPGYATFVKNGQFQPWFRGSDSLLEQATRQLSAAGKTPIQWNFAEEAAATATRNLFQSNGIKGIEVVFTP